jgi:hypothetical protein
MKRIAKVGIDTLVALGATASGAMAAQPAANAHGTRVADVAKAANYASGRAHGLAVSTEARKQGALRSAEARAKGAANAKAGKAKGAAASEPGRLKSTNPTG